MHTNDGSLFPPDCAKPLVGLAPHHTIIDHWLFYAIDQRDPLSNAAFEKVLLPVYVLFWEGKFEEAFQRVHSFSGPQLESVSQRQRARVAYLGAQLALRLQNWLKADEFFTQCTANVSREDWICRVMIDSGQATSAAFLCAYKSALDIYNSLLIALSRKAKLPFFLGSRQSFVCRTIFQRAQAKHALGMFPEALEDLDDGIPILNQWIAKRTAIWLPNRKQKPGPRLLPLKKSARRRLVHAEDLETLNWLELIHFYPWRYAMTRIWQFKLDPAPYTKDIWQEAYTALGRAARSCEQFPQLCQYAPTMHVLSGEIALMMCEQLPNEEWPAWILAAENSLAWAEAATLLSPSSPAHQNNFPNYLAVIRVTCTLQQHMLDHDSDALETLAVHTARLSAEMKIAALSEFEGRCQFALGRIYAYLKAPFLALGHYQAALALFDKEDNGLNPRFQETWRAIQELQA